MADPWLKMRIDLRDDPAVIGMSESLNMGRDTVVGKLHRIWGWFNEQTTDGRARVTQDFIDGYVECVTFAHAMIAQGWLNVEDLGGHEIVSIPNWDRHNSASAKKRALGQARAEKQRSRNASVTPPSPQRNATSALKAHQTRGEEIRKETNNKEQDQDRVVVLDMLSNESITGKAAQDLYEGGATPVIVQVAIDNADAKPPNDRPAYIVAAVRGRYGPAKTNSTPADKPWSQVCPTCGIKTIGKDVGSEWHYRCVKCCSVYNERGYFLSFVYDVPPTEKTE